MLFTRSMDIQNTNKDICLKFCKSRFVELNKREKGITDCISQ